MIIKKFLSIILSLSMLTNGIAAVVSDNDGSAFITKAEFDSLKNNFQSQLDSYNTSIDSKIDSAIASYLSGIKMSTEEAIGELVSNYKELYWCHDFSLECVKKTFSNKTSNTKNSGTYTPDYTNMTGWCPWRTNRGARGTFDFMSFWGAGMCSFWLSFNSDTGDSRDSGNEQDAHAFRYTVPLLCFNVTSDYVIREKSLLQYNRTFYPFLRFGLKPDLGWGYNYINTATSATKTMYYKPETPQTGEYIRLKMANSEDNLSSDDAYWYEIWDESNTEAFPIIFDYYDEVEPSTGGLQSNLFSYPMSTYYSISAAQATADTSRIYNMMIGTNTTKKAPFMFDLTLGGRTGQVGPATNNIEFTLPSAGLFFVDWKNWNKGKVNSAINFPSTFIANERQGARDIEISINKASSASSTLDLAIPINTTFDINKLKSDVAIFDNQNLEICGGIPIATNISKDGVLKIDMKCLKEYDDVTKPAITDANAHIKFKTTKYTDSTNKYLSGTYTGSSTKVVHDGSLTIDLTDQKFELDVKKDESVWMNIDPITLGQHIRISDLKAKLVYE